MHTYKIGFWNYEKMGVIGAEKAAGDWKDAGFNLAMTFEYDSQKNRPEEMIELLDECEKRGIRAIVCDSRTRFFHYLEAGREKFCEDAAAAVKQFGAHPAVYAFHIGDEPGGAEWEAAIESLKIVKAAAGKKKCFLNHFPVWHYDDQFEKYVGCKPDDYEDKLTDFVRRSGAEILAFDCYSQCSYTDREFRQHEFIRNLRMFSSVAKKTGAELFASVLSVGHLNFRIPSQDDLRWQLNMSVAHGATGVLWFYFYQRFLEQNYRKSPVDMFGERTETFANLAYENKVFFRYYAEKLSRCEIESVAYAGMSYGSLPVVSTNMELKEAETFINAVPLCVTRWRKADGAACYTFVNMHRELSTCLRLSFCETWVSRNGEHWLAPGQMLYVDENESV